MRDTYKDDYRTDSRNRKAQNSQKSYYSPLDMKFLSSGYYSDIEKKKLREDLLGIEAEKLGAKFAALKPELTTTQLRKFFNEVRSLEERLEESFEDQKALVTMLKSKVAYSVGKKTSKTPREFKDFMDACIDKIKDKKDFDGFIKFFESVVGYFYYSKEGGA